MEKLNDCYITYSTYDVKNFLESHDSYYRIGYYAEDEIWFLSDREIHMQMLREAQHEGYIDDANKVYSSTDHLYYIPISFDVENIDEYVRKHYIEVDVVAIYDKFILGKSFISSVNHFQTFIDIFGESKDQRSVQRHNHRSHKDEEEKIAIHKKHLEKLAQHADHGRYIFNQHPHIRVHFNEASAGEEK